MPDELRQAMQELTVLFRQQAAAQKAATKPLVTAGWAKMHEESKKRFAQRREESRERFAPMRESARRRRSREQEQDRAFQQSVLAELRRQNDLLEKVLTRLER